MDKQEYKAKPMFITGVRGDSSKTIFRFFTDKRKHPEWPPHDVDDWERNRALLQWYPEWKARLHEMHIISRAWANLVTNWASIEALYDEDYRIHGSKAFAAGKCDALIRLLTHETT